MSPETKASSIYLLDPSEYVPPEEGDRLQYLRNCVLTKDRAMDNSQNCDSYIHIYCLLLTYSFSGIKELYVRCSSTK
jgi:hypothetical protein